MKEGQLHNISTSSTCLVLGGRGFIGSHLIDKLLEQGFYVRCFDRHRTVTQKNNWSCVPNFQLFEGDISNEAEIAAALTGCDVCYHLVSTTLPESSNADPVYDIESNVVATVKLLNQAVKAGVKKVIFTSSGGTVYGNPLTALISENHPTDPVCSYGITKLTIEKYLALYRNLYGLEYSVLRLANPFGERQRAYSHVNQGAVAVFLGKVFRGETIDIWGDGSVVRDYIYIDDVVNALLAAMQPITGEARVFNIGSGRGFSLNEILDSITKITNLSVNKRYLPGRVFDVPVSVLDITLAQKILGWSPQTSFETGLAKFTQWLKKNPDAIYD